MRVTKYKIWKFNSTEALSGNLCAVVDKEVYGDSTTIAAGYIIDSNTPNLDDSRIIRDDNFLGLCICKYADPYFLVNIENNSYTFDSNGNIITTNANDIRWELVMAKPFTDPEYTEVGVSEKMIPAGNNVEISTTQTFETANYGYVDIISAPSTVKVSSLTARDQFALRVLQSLIPRIDNPAAFSDAEIHRYCEASYKWADEMLLSAAYRRVEWGDYWENPQRKYGIKGKSTTHVGNYDAWTELTDTQGLSYESRKKAEDDGWIWHKASNDDVSPTDEKLEEIAKAIQNNSGGGGGGGGGTDVSGIVSALNTLNSKNLFGRGDSSSNPIYVNCLFPNKSSLANIPKVSIKSFLTFNSDGAPGYSTIQDAVNALTAEGFTTASSPSRMYKFILGDVGYIGWQESGSGSGQIATNTVEVSSNQLISIKGAYIDFENPNGGGLRILPNYYADYAAAFHSDDSLYAFDNIEDETQFVIDCSIGNQCSFRANDFVFSMLNNSGPANITADYVYCTGVNPDSDRDLKEDIEDISLSCEDIAKMPAVSFVFKDDPKKRKNVGSIAQDWETILPEAISKNPQGNLCMNYSGAAMVSVISLAKELKALKEEVASLKEEIVELKNSK